MTRTSGKPRLLALLMGGLLVSVLGVGGALGSAPAAPAQQATATPFQVTEVATPGGDLPGDQAIALVQVATGLVDPVNVAVPPNDNSRVFVVERSGRVRIVQDGQVLEEPFLDLSDQVLDAFLEQGLYDIAFHPDFASNGLFYAHFAELLRNGDSLIVEFQVSADNPNVADPASARVLLEIDQPWANHNGGELAFGPDGLLYIGSGDGGWEGDPLEAGQDLKTLLGKVLRIDVNAAGGRPYSIPEDNPFAADIQTVQLFDVTEEEFAQIHTEARPEIWAYGLRNPWKFNFDPATGDLYLPDVGQNHWEEINFVPAGSPGGLNFGWDILMGTHCFPINLETCPAVGVLPVAEYSHDLGSAVVGIGIYRGTDFPALDGIYFAGDYGSGRIWGLAQTEDGAWAFEELLDTELLLTGSGQAPDGTLYVTSCQCTYGGPDPEANPPGTLWMLAAADSVPEGTPTAPTEGAATPGGTPEPTDEQAEPTATTTPAP